MSAAEQVLVLSLGRPSDPLLEDIILAEGYKVSRAPSLAEAVAAGPALACGTVILLLGDGTHAHAGSLLQEAISHLPQARFLISAKSGRDLPDAVKQFNLSAERLLWVEGEVGASENLDRIRRFLRGEGYCWASDLGTVPDEDDSILNATGHLDASQPEKIKSVLRFASDLSRFTELRPMLQEALRRYLEILQCEAGSIYLWDENSETLVLEAASGPEENKRLGLRQKLGEGMAGWVAEVGEPILVTDTRKVHKLQGRVCNRYANFSCIAVPITHGGQLFGVVCLTMPRDNQPFDAGDLRVAQSLSQKLASAIRPLSVLSELRRFSERLLGAFKSSSDIEIKKDAQVESLRALSINILESVPLAVIAYDRELRVRSSNKVARTLFGVEAPAGGASSPAPLEEGLELDRALWRSRLLSVIEAARKFRLQRVGYHAGTQKFVLDIHCSPMRDSEGATSGGILTVQDVTEDVELEAKLSSAERLALVGKLAAKVAHELNNPLDGILRFLNLAIRQLDNPDQARAYLEDSRAGLLRMGNILTELLAFSRSHRAPAAPVGLTQVIHQALAPYEHRAREAGIAFHVDVPPNLPPCQSNEVWEVIGNVVKNALDAIGEKGSVTFQALPQDGNVVLTISDSGPGVPMELREKIFEPFFTTKKSSHGTGLGLALCRDALRRIGGDIHLVPSEKGATFRLTLPVKQQTE